jgi:tetratricopeptide (TPR) repeat protein
MEKDILILKTIFDQANRLYKDGKYQESINLLTNTSEIWIDYQQKYAFLTILGKNFYKLDRWSESERILLETLAIYRDNITALNLLGNLYFAQNRFHESEKYYLAASRIDIYNYFLSIKAAKSAWKSGNFRRMFRRLKEGFYKKPLSKREDYLLKKLLLEFLSQSNIPESYQLVKKFRTWYYELKQRTYRKKNDVKNK